MKHHSHEKWSHTNYHQQKKNQEEKKTEMSDIQTIRMNVAQEYGHRAIAWLVLYVCDNKTTDIYWEMLKSFPISFEICFSSLSFFMIILSLGFSLSLFHSFSFFRSSSSHSIRFTLHWLNNDICSVFGVIQSTYEKIPLIFLFYFRFASPSSSSIMHKMNMKKFRYSHFYCLWLCLHLSKFIPCAIF